MREHLFLNPDEYLTVEEFHLIRKMDLPQDFLDFLEIGVSNRIKIKRYLEFKKGNINLKKERIIGNSTKNKYSQWMLH